jgi:plastocyanin
MRRLVEIAAIFGLLVLLALAGCAPSKASYTVPAGPEAKVIRMTASSFRFEPNEIFARSGDRLTIEVKNVAGMEHNLTVQDPEGIVLLDLTLPAGQTQSAALELAKPGEYRFYCGKPMHPAMGMTGRIVAGAPSSD